MARKILADQVNCVLNGWNELFETMRKELDGIFNGHNSISTKDLLSEIDTCSQTLKLFQRAFYMILDVTEDNDIPSFVLMNFNEFYANGNKFINENKHRFYYYSCKLFKNKEITDMEKQLEIDKFKSYFACVKEAYEECGNRFRDSGKWALRLFESHF